MLNSNKDVGKQFGDWTIIQHLGHGKVLCQCSCGTVKELYKKSLIEGKTKSCGCKKYDNFRKSVSESLVGSTFGEWTVVSELGSGYVECKCSCGTIRKIRKTSLKNGATKSCGCKQTNNFVDTMISKNNTTGNKYGTLTVIKELGSGMVLCECECGTITEVRKQNLISGHTKSCGCKTVEFRQENTIKDVTNNVFGYWTVIKELGNNLILCRCECGTEKILRKDIVTQGKSKSCGCKTAEIARDTMLKTYGEVSIHKADKPREPWQIDVVSSKDKFIEFITTNYSYKPTIQELSYTLGINNASVGRIINSFDICEYIQKNPIQSYLEIEIAEYIKEITNNRYNIQTNYRKAIGKLELDIFIPELNIAIEFNGSYWHSSIFKDRKYHQNKTIACAKHGIRLIHIFEYEWVDSEKQVKIKNYLKDILCRQEIEKIYGRNTKIVEISSKEASEFIEKYHIQGKVNSPINIGCYLGDELLGVMTFGKPRFTSNNEYEIHRLCWKSGKIVLGGAQKMLKYFEDLYKPSSIITYADISKFTGNIYTKLGFGNDKIIAPGYVWVSPDNKVISRNKSQKHKLVQAGLGDDSQTEEQIMESLGYFKVYDSGNIRLEKGGEEV